MKWVGISWQELVAVLVFAHGAILPMPTASGAGAGPVAHWRFDEIPGGGTAFDASGTLNGTLSPAGSAFVPGGIAGNALSLTRSLGGYVDMGNALGHANGVFTMSVWVRTTSLDTTDNLIVLSKHATGDRNGYFLLVNTTGGLLLPDRASLVIGGTGTDPISTMETPVSSTAVNDGAWHHIVAVHDVELKRIYVDGTPVEDSKPNQAYLQNTASFLIGGIMSASAPVGLFEGLIDDVQIYDRALADAEIQFLFENPGVPAGPPPPPPSAITNLLYSTRFELSEGFNSATALVGQNNWMRTGNGVAGLTNLLVEDGQQAFLGGSATGLPASRETYVWQPVNFSPLAASLPVVAFAVRMAIFDSTNDRFDGFSWDVYNRDVEGLFTLIFDNRNFGIGYALDNGQPPTSTGFTFATNTPFTLAITLDFARNLWWAKLDEQPVVNAQPITTRGAALTLGDINAVWFPTDVSNPGNNLMTFDNLIIVARSSPRVPPSLNLSPGSINATLSLTGEPAGTYAIDLSTNLLMWTPVFTNTTADGSFRLTDGFFRTIPQRYFRARILP